MLKHRKWTLIAMMVIGLVGCGAQNLQQAVSEAGTTVTQTLSKASIDQLSVQLPDIEHMVESGRTEEARAAFNRFLQGWDAIKFTVQQVAPDSATSIQNALDRVKQALIDTPKPTTAEVKAALEELKKQLTNLGGGLQ